MNYEFNIYHELPSADILNGIEKLHKTVFGPTDDLINILEKNLLD
ncbi:MAG TPA: hypothetical protein VNM69_05685 [Bacillus sp. (in: firmicutes)]|nr:hypothetical protein [Bacillus litorisediminis]HWO75397.1 hypothetical protein [Bacillus sp. (in: firmicutes)]